MPPERDAPRCETCGDPATQVMDEGEWCDECSPFGHGPSDPFCATCDDSEEIEVGFSDSTEPGQGTRFVPCPACAARPPVEGPPLDEHTYQALLGLYEATLSEKRAAEAERDALRAALEAAIICIRMDTESLELDAPQERDNLIRELEARAVSGGEGRS